MPRPLQGMVLVWLPEWVGRERFACSSADWKTSLQPQRDGWVQERRHHGFLIDSQRNDLCKNVCKKKDKVIALAKDEDKILNQVFQK